MSQYFFKIENLSPALKESLKAFFPKITPGLEEQFFSEDTVIISGTNKNLGNALFSKLKASGFIIKISGKEEIKGFEKFGSVTLPHPENPKVYDIISFYRHGSSLELQRNKEIAIIRNDEKLFFASPHICKGCYRETPSEVSFCLNCGLEFMQREALREYSIKITSIEDHNTAVKLAKYITKNTSFHNFKTILDGLTHLPTIINFSIMPSQLNGFIEMLHKYNVIYEPIESGAFRLDKFFASFRQHGSLNLGSIKLKKSYFDPVMSKLGSDSLKHAFSDSLKNAVTQCLYEAYRIIEYTRNSESSAKVLFESLENDLDELLGNFFYFINRANNLTTYLQEKSPEKIRREIALLQKQMEHSSEMSVRNTYEEAVTVKEQEAQDLLKIQNTMEMVKAQILSVATLLSSLRTKITCISNYDIENKKGDYAELNQIKKNLNAKLSAIQEILG